VGTDYGQSDLHAHIAAESLPTSHRFRCPHPLESPAHIDRNPQRSARSQGTGRTCSRSTGRRLSNSYLQENGGSRWIQVRKSSRHEKVLLVVANYSGLGFRAVDHVRFHTCIFQGCWRNDRRSNECRLSPRRNMRIDSDVPFRPLPATERLKASGAATAAIIKAPPADA